MNESPVVGTDPDEPATHEQAVAQLVAIVSASDDALISTTLDGVILTWNKGAERLFLWAPGEIVGHRLELLVPPERRDEYEAILERMAREGTVQRYETQRFRKDGSLLDVAVTLSPMHGESGDLIGIAALIRDIREQKAAQLALQDALDKEREAHNKLQELDAMKNEFVAMVAHDLRSPMAVISGYAQSLSRYWQKIEESERDTFLIKIVENIRKLTELIENVLQVARIDTGEISYKFVPVDAKTQIERIVDEMRTSDERRRFNVNVSQGLPMMIADEQRVWQVLTNLVTNAMKFSPPEEPIDISASPEKSGVKISVRDRGIGLPEAEHPKLFQRFSRIGSADTPRGGLGLYLCRVMVEAMNGTIGVESEEGKGSTFFFTLPSEQ